MAIYDNNGSTNAEIGKLYDNNGTASTQIGKVYDNNGTTNSLIYQSTLILVSGSTYSHNPVVYESTNNSCGASLQFTSTGVYYKSRHDSDKNECYYEIRFQTGINLSDYAKCYVTLQVSGNRNAEANDRVGFSTSSAYTGGYKPAYQRYVRYYSGTQTYTIDVSDLTGTHYFKISGRRPAADKYAEIRITSLYLE